MMEGEDRLGTDIASSHCDLFLSTEFINLILWGRGGKTVKVLLNLKALLSHMININFLHEFKFVMHMTNLI